MSPRLEHLELEIERAEGALLPQVRRGLAERLGPDAEALRWAITAVTPPTGHGPARLTIEAVVLRWPL
ncbi:MAG: hypothetical protein VKO44_11370 [Cyanobacteriota bacterium]|nr:hypothetical protein [Cyanobacteriota bacterium]